ncbi:MAG TPA: hypothetical protein DEG17_01950 [Cyanobacteria bacterium UBA11149]|nr:hypothetical protein [Cyanobacteria bacterium UBA11367]HBE57849.1 hypothetical protein [Cyanobacteria bacterium UBA11366]HBK61958.1 hypothetical protein [Cyanobacteria bacterium UBA11166]HBR76541.1 hypothetical protein [Cyanobacteria bacterium UBA11159]HBS67917.1 hypothetical protein [Cyanobacteria bacterium UBA11153]HBW87672.1 hypothetical protein [Cyanobacteria bacterium UBA11149]HCA96488.1 hypothetical protein [Cyanobacteria bacterium UBA9226]
MDIPNLQPVFRAIFNFAVLIWTEGFDLEDFLVYHRATSHAKNDQYARSHLLQGKLERSLSQQA